MPYETQEEGGEGGMGIKEGKTEKEEDSLEASNERRLWGDPN